MSQPTVDMKKLHDLAILQYPTSHGFRYLGSCRILCIHPINPAYPDFHFNSNVLSHAILHYLGNNPPKPYKVQYKPYIVPMYLPLNPTIPTQTATLRTLKRLKPE